MDNLLNNKMHQFKKNINNIIMLILSLLLLMEMTLCVECPRDKPIMKGGECQSIYCKPEEFEDYTCIKSNPYVKSQWLNKINNFGSTGIFNICPVSNLNGDIFLLASNLNADYGSKYIYAFSSDGNGLFYDDINKTNYTFENISFPSKNFVEYYHSVYINDKEYLLSTQNSYEMFLIDIYNKKYFNYVLNTEVYYSENIFKLNGYENYKENIYFTSYIYFDEKSNIDQCYLGLRIFKLDLKDITVLLEMPDKIQVHYESSINCFQNDDLYIQCIYDAVVKNDLEETYNHVISLFNYKTLKLEFSQILEENFAMNGYFDSTIQLNGNIFVTGYSYPNNKNVIKLL